MTLEEKRNAIKDYCGTKSMCKSTAGYRCPLFGLSGGCYTNVDDAEIIERNFKLISEMPDYNGVKEGEAQNEDLVNHPSHYTQGGMETIEEMELIFGIPATMDYCLLNAWKYRARAPYKGNPEQDMDKSNWYLNKYKELKERAYGKE